MKKAAVILNVVTDGTTYIATYESGKVVAASVETMPGTVKKWLETHTGAQEGAETETAEEMTGEEIAAAFEGETVTEDAAEIVVSSQVNVEAPRINSAAEMAENTRDKKIGFKVADYACMPVNPDSLREIASEGVQAAAFAGAAIFRLVTCIGLAVSLITRRTKAAVTAWITAAFDWIVSVFVACWGAYNMLVDAITYYRNIAAPYFWRAVEWLSRAWEFRAAVLKEM